MKESILFILTAVAFMALGACQSDTFNGEHGVRCCLHTPYSFLCYIKYEGLSGLQNINLHAGILELSSRGILWRIPGGNWFKISLYVEESRWDEASDIFRAYEGVSTQNGCVQDGSIASHGLMNISPSIRFPGWTYVGFFVYGTEQMDIGWEAWNKQPALGKMTKVGIPWIMPESNLGQAAIYVKPGTEAQATRILREFNGIETTYGTVHPSEEPYSLDDLLDDHRRFLERR